MGLALVPLDCLLIRDLVLSCDEVNGLMDGLDAATSTGGGGAGVGVWVECQAGRHVQRGKVYK